MHQNHKVNHSRSLKSATSLKLKITETVGLFPKVVTIWYNKLTACLYVMNERKNLQIRRECKFLKHSARFNPLDNQSCPAKEYNKLVSLSAYHMPPREVESSTKTNVQRMTPLAVC